MDQILNTFSKLNDTVGSPISALLIIIIGWFVAGLIKKLIYNISKKTGIAKSLSTDKVDFAKIISQIFYLFIMIFVFLLALNTLGMDNVLEPVKNMLNNFFAFLPNVFGAGLVAYIGYMLATIVSELVALSGNTIQKLTVNHKYSGCLHVSTDGITIKVCNNGYLLGLRFYLSDQTQWYNGKIACRSAGRHGVQSSIPGRGE